MSTTSLCLFRLPRSSLICCVVFNHSEFVLDSSTLCGFAASVLDVDPPHLCIEYLESVPRYTYMVRTEAYMVVMKQKHCDNVISMYNI